MDVSKVFSKVKELGHVNSRREELREYCKIKIDQMLKFLPRRILNSDGADLLDCLFNGLPDCTSNCTKYKVKVIDIVLQEMRKESTSLTHTGDVISRVCLELSRVPAGDLVRWSGDSIQSIIEDKDVSMIWKDVLPECLSALSSHTQLQHCGTTMTPDEYKEQCVNTLCQCKWKEAQLVQLTAMFKDMNLSKADHTQVVNKICSYIIDITPDTLPPLVHQLIKLCNQYDMEIVLHHVSHYFNARLYTKLDAPPNDSESTTMDIDELVPYSTEELHRCLSTCIYHLCAGAAEPELLRKHLKNWPKQHLMRSPFLLDLALALADKGTDFRTVCLDVIKSAIEQNILDVQRSKESSFVRSVLKNNVDAATVLKLLTNQSSNHRQITVLGLMHLAFSLLSTAGSRPGSHAMRSLGKLVLVRLSKSHPESAGHILRQLADWLAAGGGDHFADCLYLLCKMTPLSIERCTELSLVLEQCTTPAAVLAIRPLLAHSTRVRDTVTLLSRKRLYSRECSDRQLAVWGFLCLVRYTTTPASTNSSQCDSAHSCLTQLTVDLHSTAGNLGISRVRTEAVCMEVVSILRRCLVQDASVKQLLFDQIYESSKDKNFLHESLLELLYEHLSKYLSEDQKSLLFDKCVNMTATTAVLTEPISHLIYCCAQFLQREEDELEDILESQSEFSDAHLRSKLIKILQDFCENDDFARIDTDECGLADLTPESKAKALKVQQMLQCYEALIAHKIMQWDRNSKDVANEVYKLYATYNHLLETTKIPSKASKKKSLNDTKDTTKSQKSQKSQQDKPKAKGKGPGKLSNLVKERAGPFKSLPCVWDLAFCCRVIQLLYSAEVPWCTVEQRNQLRSRRDFHRAALRCVQSVLLRTHVDANTASVRVINIAQVLYERCLCRFQDMCDFDDQTASATLDLLKECLTFLFSNNCSLKSDYFMPRITGLTENSASASIAAMIEQVLSPLESTEESETDDDVLDKKTVVSLMALINVLLATPVDHCTRYANVIARLEDLCRSSKRDCLPLLGPTLNAGCRIHTDAPFLNDLLIKITQALTTIDEDDSAISTTQTVHFPYIDETSGHTALACVCAHLMERAAIASALSHRAATHTYSGNTETQDLQKSLVPELCQLTTWVSSVCKLRCTVGSGSDKVLLTCVRLYRALQTFVKHLSGDVAGLRLERLFKLSGKKLSGITDNLITYLEACQQQQSSAVVLRHTRHIPRLVLEHELYCRQLHTLHKHTKINIQQYISLGTARDFRIKGPVLEEMLKARDNVDDETRDNVEEDINDAETTLLSVPSDQEEEESATKRRRKS